MKRRKESKKKKKKEIIIIGDVVFFVFFFFCLHLGKPLGCDVSAVTTATVNMMTRLCQMIT